MRLGRLIGRHSKITRFAALFAIVLQLAVAATHHHPVFFGGNGPIASQKSLVSAQDNGSAPASEETCEICLGLALGSSFVVPDAILLDLALATAPSQLGTTEDRARTLLLAFQSRAPPLL